MKEFKCKCHTIIDLNKLNMESKKGEKYLACPKCKLRYVLIKYNNDLVRDATGKLIRKHPKIKMSKKERLKLKREKQLVGEMNA